MAGDGVSIEDTQKWKRKNYADSASTNGAIEGQIPPENCTNAVSRATRATIQAKPKLIASTKQAAIALVVATPSTVPTAAQVTRLST